MGLQAQGIIRSIDVAVLYQDVTAVHDVYTIVIPIVLAVHVYPADSQMLALVAYESPLSGVLEFDPVDQDTVALPEIEQFRAA